MDLGGEHVSPLNIPAWRGFPLRARLAAHTGLPVSVDNDAKALALGEGWTGAAAGRRNYLGMVVSTGVGGGIVTDGRLLDGVGGNAGHIGHVIVEPEGHECGCGARGCLEAEASGLAIAPHHRPAARRGDTRHRRPHRHARRARGRERRQPARSRSRGRRGIRRARLRHALLRRRASARSTRAAASSSRAAPASSPARSGATARSSARPPSPSALRLSGGYSYLN